MLSLSLELQQSVAKSHTRYSSIICRPTKPQQRGAFDKAKNPSSSVFNIELDDTPSTQKLTITNFPKTLKYSEIREILSEFGEVKSLVVPQNSFFGKNFGKAIVEFDSDVAEKVLEHIKTQPVRGFDLDGMITTEEVPATDTLSNLSHETKNKPVEKKAFVEDVGDDSFLPDASDFKKQKEPEEPLVVFEKKEQRRQYQVKSKFTLGEGEVNWPGPVEPYAEHWSHELLRLASEEEAETSTEVNPWKEARYNDLIKMVGDRKKLSPNFWKTYYYVADEMPAPEPVKLKLPLKEQTEKEVKEEEATKEVELDEPEWVKEVKESEKKQYATLPKVVAGESVADMDAHWIKQDYVLWRTFQITKLQKYGLLKSHPAKSPEVAPAAELKLEDLYSPYEKVLNNTDAEAKAKQEEEKFALSENKLNGEFDLDDLQFTLSENAEFGSNQAKSSQLLDAIVKLWNDDKMEDLFGRPGLLYQRMIPDPKLKTVYLDVVFPYYYTQEYYDNMVSTVLGPYIAALFGIPLRRITHLEIVSNPDDTRETRVFLKFQDVEPEFYEEYYVSRDPIDVHYANSAWQEVIEDDIPEDEEVPVIDKATYPYPDAKDFYNDFEDAFVRVINPSAALLPYGGVRRGELIEERWDHKWTVARAQRLQAQEDQVDRSMAPQLLQDDGNNPWVTSATKE